VIVLRQGLVADLLMDPIYSSQGIRTPDSALVQIAHIRGWGLVRPDQPNEAVYLFTYNGNCVSGSQPS
jgi:hypothetical protein